MNSTLHSSTPQSESPTGMNSDAVLEVLESGISLLRQGVPLIGIRYGGKRPLADSSGTWRTYDDEVAFQESLSTSSLINIGVQLHPKADSSIICLDVEGKAGQREVNLLRDLVGNSRDSATWQQKTGSGGYHLFYFWQGEPLQRIADKPDDLEIDLLANGYALVAPSTTHLEGGGAYRWIEGHSPLDIELAMLDKPPDRLLDWWHERAKGRPSTTQSAPADKSKAWALITEPINEGGRNETLCRIAGWLRQFHPAPVVEALLICVNDSRCHPPLPDNEVRAIVQSVVKYPQAGVNGHPRAVVPSFTREVTE